MTTRNKERDSSDRESGMSDVCTVVERAKVRDGLGLADYSAASDRKEGKSRTRGRYMSAVSDALPTILDPVLVLMRCMQCTAACMRGI